MFGIWIAQTSVLRKRLLDNGLSSASDLETRSNVLDFTETSPASVHSPGSRIDAVDQTSLER